MSTVQLTVRTGANSNLYSDNERHRRGEKGQKRRLRLLPPLLRGELQSWTSFRSSFVGFWY